MQFNNKKGSCLLVASFFVESIFLVLFYWVYVTSKINRTFLPTSNAVLHIAP